MMDFDHTIQADWVWPDSKADHEEKRPFEFSIIRSEDSVRVALLVLLLIAAVAYPPLLTNHTVAYLGLVVGAFLTMWTCFEADWLDLRRHGLLGNGAVVVVIGDFAWLTLFVFGTGGLHSPFVALPMMPILFSVALFSRMKTAVMLVTALAIVGYDVMAMSEGLSLTGNWELAGTLLSVLAIAWVAHGICLVLERERRTNELVIRNMSEGVMLLDADRRIVVANRQLERLTGISPDGIAGRTARDVMNADSLAVLRPILKDVGQADELSDQSTREVTISGHEALDLRVTTTRCLGPAGEGVGYVVICQDITPVKTAIRVKENGLSMLSHEIRSPLTTLRVTASMLTALADRLSDERLSHFAEILDCETQRLVWIAGELLNISTLEDPEAQAERAPTDVATLVRRIRRVIQAKAGKEDITVTGTVEGDLQDIPVDAKQVESAVHRLCDNAVKYTAPGGSISLDARRDGDRLLISVSDDGRGIPQDQLDVIFEKFAQLEDDRTLEKSERGAGLGLYVVRRIAQLHGGDVSVESEPGGGSTFTLELPLVEPEDTQAPSDMPRIGAAIPEPVPMAK